MMNFIPARSPDQGIEALASRIAAALSAHKKAVWLVCGGSNIPSAVRALDMVRAALGASDGPADAAKPNALADLTIAQTDERYGPVGHADSNWRQLLDAGLRASGAKTIPVLVGKSLDATVSEYADALKPAMDEAARGGGVIIAQFGIGADGHIAGMLPRSPALSDPRLVTGYEAGQYIRITLTAAGILKIDEAYVLAFGKEKREALHGLVEEDLPLDDSPCSILKNVPKVFIWSDVLP